MPSQRDPEKILTKCLSDILDLANAHILEIGSGDGHLTWCYAASAKRIVGLDPNAKRLVSALRDQPPALRTILTFVQARAEALPFRRETFDAIILSWTL